MTAMTITRLDSQTPDFDQTLTRLLSWDSESGLQVEAQVAAIIARIRCEGDPALIDYTRTFDRHAVTEAAALELSRSDLEAAWQSLDAGAAEALETAAHRIRQYAEHQKLQSWHYTEACGTVLGQQVTPLDRVGVYVPGGKAAYPSSVLMNVIPARVAGVPEIIMVVPTPEGHTNPWVMAAAWLAGVDRVFTVGGAQAVAALAYGTATIPRVDKIVGPGNIYVATAKKQVFGQVGIDMIAGPSEILIVSDGSLNPDWLAMDLFSQAEHDEEAQAILISPDAAHLDAVEASLHRLLPGLERASIIATALQRRGALIRVRDLDEATRIVNRIAPEHLELAVADPESLRGQIRNAGALFMGHHTPEALGDYCAGPNHVLPTAGTARFSSPLGVYDFQKRTSLIYCSRQGADTLAQTASVLARGEGLTAHARSAEYRIEPSA
jgi:histidinol dehydrogenase